MKKFYYLIFILFVFFIFQPTVFAASAEICTKPGILKSFRFIGYLLYVVKVLIPIILIITGSMDYAKAILASNQDAIKKATVTFGTRIVAGVVVFLIPTVVNFAFSLLPENKDNFKACSTCIFKPRSCKIK